MKTSKIFGLFAIVVFTLALAGTAFALPITIDEVKVDGTVMNPDGTNRLSIERNEKFDVRVEITASAEHENMVAQIFIAGYEHDDETLSDLVGPFDVEANTTYVKRFELKLPEDIDEDTYKLRIMFTDRNSKEIVQNYNLKIDRQDNSVKVDDVILYPSNSIDAGSALLVIVRVENFGDDDEDDVRVRISMPALGLSATDYIDEIDPDDIEETEELYLRIPRETKSGDYELKVVVDFDDNHETVEKSFVVHVEGDETYQATQQPMTIITAGSTLETVEAGQSVIFPLTIGNAGTTDRAYSIAVTGVQNWAEVKISPTTTQIVKSGESKAFYLSVAVDKDSEIGLQVLTATISSGTDQIEEIALTVNVTEKKRSLGATVGKILGITLIVLLAILVLFGLAAGISRMKNKDEEYVSESETYY